MRQRAAPAWLAAALTGAALAGPAPAGGQSADAVGERPDPAPAWLSRWRPLETIGDLTRTLPAIEHGFPDALTRPEPRVGLLWTVGNPAALALEVDEARVDFGLAYADDSGDYRRPLDPGSRQGVRFSGLGWRTVGSGAVIGRVGVERTSIGEGAFSDILVPYAGSPFVVLDTLGDALDRTLARIEGAGGWSLGEVAVGVGLGYESQDTRTQRTNVPRTNETATPGATLGVVWSGAGDVRVGAHARWQQTAEDLVAFAIGAASRFYAPNGYVEPVAFDLNSAVFQRRYERTGWAAGLSVAGGLFGEGDWVVYGQRETLSEERFSPRTNDPLTDTWDADGWTIGGAVGLSGSALSAMLDGRFTTLDGEGFRGDIELVSFTSAERRMSLEGDLRWRPTDAWTLAARVGLKHEERERSDLIEQVGTDISAWSPSAALEAARRLSGRLSISVGASGAGYSPSASTPDPEPVGPAYGKWIAPAPGLHATAAAGWAVRGTLHLRVGSASAVWLRGQYRTASPDASGPLLPDSPSGERSGWLTMLGATLTPPR